MHQRYEVFGTRGDWIRGLTKIEAELQPKFVQLGLFSTPEIPVYSSLVELEDLGISQFGTHPTERTFFIVPKNAHLDVKLIPQRRGGERYSVEQGKNDMCVFFRPGGIFCDECLISGLVAAMGKSKESLEYFSRVSSLLLDGFVPVKYYFVGPEALQLLESGFRLTNNHKRPLIDDLAK